MKKIIIMGLVIIMSMTGCTSKKNDSLEDFYGKLINKQYKEISMDEVKKSLKNFEYEYELFEYSKEDMSEYELDMELNDLSFNKFKDEEGNFIDISFNETNKKVSGLQYSKIEDEITINLNCSQTFSSATISGTDIEKQKDILKKLKLYKNLNQVVDNYFEIVSNLFNKKHMTIDNVKEILKTDYEEINEEYSSDDSNEYAFVPEGAKGVDIKVETKGRDVIDINLYINLVEDSNYILMLMATNEDITDENTTFKLQTSILSNINEEYIDESGQVKEGALTEKNIELFSFIFKDKGINFYSENYDEDSEKEIPLFEVKFDKSEDVNSIYFMDKRAIEEERPYDIDKTFKIKLKRDELIKVEIEMEAGKNLSIPIVITLQDLSSGEYIYSKSVDNTNENIFTTGKVDKDGEYEISVVMSDLEKYKFKILAVKE